MEYSVVPVETFEKSISKLDREVSRRVLQKLEWLAMHPTSLPAPMGGLPKDWAGLTKTRVGDWRVFYRVEHTKKEVRPYFVLHRDEGYEWMYQK